MAASTDEPLQVLLVDGEPELARQLSSLGLDVRSLGAPEQVPDALRARHADAILLTLAPDGDLGPLDRLLAARPPVPVVAAGELCTEDQDLEVIARGAEDFVPLPVDASRVVAALRLATVRFRTRTPPAPQSAAAPPADPGSERMHPLWKLEPGTVIDRYEVERIVGRGGMAVVYRVRHRKLGSVHALKVVLPTMAGLTQRLMVEGQAQARLRHPNLVGATDVLELDQGIGLVMEYVEGPTLQEWMDHTTASGTVWLRLFRGVVRGLRHAHAHGLVHRDLKPANVLLQETAEGHVPKIADFGIARMLPRKGAGPLDGGPAIAVGTVGYAAPEQYIEPESVDPRSDLFSLGCVLYALACGVPPFTGPEPIDIVRATRCGRPTPPHEVVPDLPQRFSDIVAGLLRVDPGRRTADCQILLEQLDELDARELPTRHPAAPGHLAGETLDTWSLDASEPAWTTGWQPSTPEG